ncbi:PQQ-dependent sugar dehydrogenase [Altererythrobacter litoralis]|uniref:PQQ-dependent sugar dehydrogenase n=1 Tax=Altererythrobacter litoralis TaxID=3113904 RepID=A0ABU7GHG7_9SPHN|nr:PQQ-dependent sugar dehydrogenase [Erythrobacteraceae bacterium 1XM1-14]
MTMISKLSPALFPASILLASCGATAHVDTGPAAADVAVEEVATYERPWAAAFVPGTEVLVITLKAGELRGIDTATGRQFVITGAPQVDFGGQGGLGDVAFLPSEAAETVGSRTIYLSWAEAGENDTRGAVVGRGTLNCVAGGDCAVEGLKVIWRQAPKVTGRGHYSHRIRFSPDERYMFVASGDRQKMQPAQDTTNTLGSIVRLNLDGSPAEGNPLASEGGVTAQIWSWGHRNILGMDWDAEVRLWEVEHGPAGGDELNLVKPGANYGWPERSFGEHYNGDPIPDHAADDGFAQPAAHWTPVIAPSDMIFYRGDMFGGWKGDALITGLGSEALVRVEIDGETAHEAARFPIGGRLRSIDEGPDGALWVLEDGEGARLLKVTPK